MGVSFHAAGLAYSDSYDCGYLTFNAYRCELAKAMSPKIGEIYRGWLFTSNGTYTDDTGTHKDGCTFFIDLTDSDDPLRASSPEMKALYKKKCDELSELGLFGFDFEAPVHGLVGAKVSCCAKYNTLDAMFDKAFPQPAGGFLFAPDCEGKLNWKECRDLYLQLSSYKLDMQAHNYGECETMKTADGKIDVKTKDYNIHDRFLSMFRHCWKRHVNLYWS